MIFKRKKRNKKIIFVIGAGRSGTHLLGRTIGNLDEIDAFIEDKMFFKPITNLVVNKGINEQSLNELLQRYEKVFKKSKKETILEKTHPNIWLVEELQDFFKESYFIGIRRNVYATVASMLNHQGVLQLFDRANFSEVNDFFGITKENLDYYEELPLESKFALSWKAHSERLASLEKTFPDRVLVMEYEEFYGDLDSLFEKINTFLHSDFEFKLEPLNPNGLEKWKSYLTADQIENINKFL